MRRSAVATLQFYTGRPGRPLSGQLYNTTTCARDANITNHFGSGRRITGCQACECLRCKCDRSGHRNGDSRFLDCLAWGLQGDSAGGRRPFSQWAEVGPVPVLPDEPAALREDAALPLLDVHGTDCTVPVASNPFFALPTDRAAKPGLHQSGNVQTPAAAIKYAASDLPASGQPQHRLAR
jgi:hypothetical protein